ncbi:MAG: isocitrate/isopropylmalate dehydrogenase family protein, partial [Clostridia bacterium]|nr:isocitrate/isopropylmalate dehydrogenase family protein [Clostridia bacterium]
MQKYIDSAVEQFRALITEQLERQNEMEKGAAVKDFANADKIVIGICGGDGIGPVITAASQRVLEYLLADEIKSGRIEMKVIDGLTIENREACGKAIPDDV